MSWTYYKRHKRWECGQWIVSLAYKGLWHLWAEDSAGETCLMGSFRTAKEAMKFVGGGA